MVICALGLTGICGGAAIYFAGREKKLADKIQKLLDDAIDGKLPMEQLNETKVSAIETNMRRYLCDRQVLDGHLKEEKRQIQTRISDISHQAVIPIANIILYTQLVEEGLALKNTEDNQDVLDEIAAIREQAWTLDFLIEALIKLSRLETGIISITAKRQGFQPVLDAVKSQFQAKAQQKSIQLTIAATDKKAVFDKKWTIEAISNIVDNAVKYTSRGGKVSISVETLPSLLRIDVTDTGIGIDEREQANIFTRFYRSEAVADQAGEGIGLYLAREVMKAQNGYIKLYSHVGQGSTFSLYFLRDEISQK